jgi:NAD(P)-dependent dehydrogenase (short-subunit alcohol dehydrogenase family)
VLLGAYVPLDDFSAESFRRVLQINTTGSFMSAKYAAPLMRKAGKGVVVLVSSGAATGGSSSYAYGASKGGVHSLGIVLANALAIDNIRVNVLAPGNIDTPMKRSVIAADVQRKGRPESLESAVADSNLGTPQGVARVLAWLASDDADYVRGVISTR